MRPRTPRRPRQQRSTERLAAVVALGLIAAMIYLAFGPGNPLAEHFEISAEVTSTIGLRNGSPVRVAGIQVGQVTAIRRGSPSTATIVLRLDDHAGLHADASLAVAPRLLVEGNSYVDLHPGTPAAPPLHDGDRLPRARTSAPVQLDQVLSVLQPATRTALQSGIRELHGMLGQGPHTDPARRTSGAAALRGASAELARTLPSFTRVAESLRGTRPGDLQRAVAHSRDAASQLAADPARLGALVGHYDTVIGVLSDHERSLQQSVGALARTLGRAPAQLSDIDAGLDPLARYADRLRPALRAAPPALRAATAALAQAHAASGPHELPRLLSALRPVTSSLPALTDELTRTTALVDQASRCVSRNVVPTLNKELPDGRLSSGRPAWQDLLHMAAALTGTSPGFDGNGGTLRISVAEGANAVRGLLPGVGPIASSANLEGVRPRWLGPGATPPFRPDARCTAQALPDLARRSAPGLPTGVRRVAEPTLSTAAAQGKAAIVRGIYGSRADRLSLYRRLMRGIPALTPRPAPVAPTTRRPLLPGLTLPARPAAPTPAPATRPDRVPPAPTTAPAPLSAVTELLKKLLPGLDPGRRP